MTSITQISSISLSFNDSWLAHIGSRIYRMAIKTIESLGTAFSCSFIQPYAGRQLYQLVDTYRESINNKELYDKARSSYATSIVTALQGEKNILEKTKRARTILNTHIIGLSILQAKDKQALSEHVAYTLLSSLIHEFGAKIVSRSILALHELDNIDQSKSLNEYAKLYRDIALQQSDLDSFVEALQELNSYVPKDILIHELLLSRNRNLTDLAKAKITSILKNEHYIDIKAQKKLQLLNHLKSEPQANELSKSEIAELQYNRDVQVDALHYMGPSIFFNSIDTPFIDESGDECPEAEDARTGSASPDTTDIFYDCCEAPLDMITEQPIQEPLIPLGISNTNQNCWYNAALQVMNNTPLYSDILQQNNKFSTDFPNIWESLNSYRNSSRFDEKKQPNRLHLDEQMGGIRKEIQDKINSQVQTNSTQEDSKWFLTNLLEKLSIDTYFTMIGNEEDVNDIIQRREKNTLDKQTKHLLVEVERTLAIDLDLFTHTEYQPYGIILHDGGSDSGHYTAAVQKGQSWYLCNDSYVREAQEAEINKILQNNTTQAFIIASRKK